MNCSSPGSSVHGTPQARIRRVLSFLSSEDLTDPGTEFTFSALAGRSLAAEPRGSSKWMTVAVKSLSRVWLSLTIWTAACQASLSFIGVGCHFLLQGIFPTQGSKPGLWPRRKIFFYHLSHHGSPSFKMLNLLTCQMCVICNCTNDEYFYLLVQNMWWNTYFSDPFGVFGVWNTQSWFSFCLCFC